MEAESRGSLLAYASVNSRSAYPPGNPGAFAHVVSPWGGALAMLSRPGGWAFAYPQAIPRAFDSHVAGFRGNS